MDIIMQGMDGLDASEIILKEHPEARIVMISSLAYDEVNQLCASAVLIAIRKNKLYLTSLRFIAP